MRRLTVSGDRYVFLFIISLFLRDDYFLSIHNIAVSVERNIVAPVAL